MEDGHLGVLGQVVQNYAQLMEVMLLNVIGSVTCRPPMFGGKTCLGNSTEELLTCFNSCPGKTSLFVYLKNDF